MQNFKATKDKQGKLSQDDEHSQSSSNESSDNEEVMEED